MYNVQYTVCYVVMYGMYVMYNDSLGSCIFVLYRVGYLLVVINSREAVLVH